MFPFCEAGMQWPSCPQPKGPGAHDSAGSIALFLGMSALGERWRSGQGGLRSIGRASFRLQHPGKVAKKKVAANYGLPNLRMSAHVRKFGDFLIIWEIIVLCFGRPSLASFATVLLVQYHFTPPSHCSMQIDLPKLRATGSVGFSEAVSIDVVNLLFSFFWKQGCRQPSSNHKSCTTLNFCIWCHQFYLSCAILTVNGPCGVTNTKCRPNILCKRDWAL